MKVYSLEERYNSVSRRRYLWSVVALYTLLLFVSFPYMLIAYVACTLQVLRLYNYMKWMARGLNGERQVGKELRQLPGNSIPSSVYMVNGDKFEVDYLYIGSTGIFAIEVKTFRGSINANSQDDFWIQQKKTKKNHDVTNKIPNPIPLLKSKSTRLNEALQHIRMAKHKKFIHGIVVVVAEEVAAQGKDVYKVRDLKGTLTTGKRRLTDEDQLELYKALNGLKV